MGQLILNRKCYQVFKPEMEFNMLNIIYVALRMCTHTEKTTFKCKDSYWTTDNKPEMLSGVQTGNEIQHVEYNIRGIAHVHAYRKDDI